MKKFSRVVVSVVFAVAAVGVASPVRADPAGDALIAAVDAAMNRAKTLVTEYEAQTQEPNKPARALGLTVRQRGEKRLLEVFAPAELKGTKLLVVSPTAVYAYLPSYGKVRRLAAPSMGEGLFGMTYSADDVVSPVFANNYTGTISGQDAAAATVVLTPKAGKETAFAKIEVVVNKDRNLPAELRYFNAQGVKVRTETRTGYTCEGNVCGAGELTLTDHVSGASTKLVRKAWKVNVELSDDLFSTRNLTP